MSMKYDCIIIGAGMSGIAAGIRLAHYGKKVCILERHSREGGLNSFYSRGRFEFETGLHAMTNFVKSDAPKNSPLLRLLRQLRIPYEAMKLREQNHSLIKFPSATLDFTNNFADFMDSVASAFPVEADNFRRLDAFLTSFNELDLALKPESARAKVSESIKSPLLVDMLFCPLMYYGSATENDMELGQFVVMYKSIFKEGFCRPADTGIRLLLGLLFNRFSESGGELRMKTGVKRIISREGAVVAVETDAGEILETTSVLSSAGLPETLSLCDVPDPLYPEPEKSLAGGLAFVEAVSMLNDSYELKNDATIIFYSLNDKFRYQAPSEPYSLDSGVICMPQNFRFRQEDFTPGKAFRVTCLANYEKWQNLSAEEYYDLKKATGKAAFENAEKLAGISGILDNSAMTDIISPLSISRYTSRMRGAIYGSPIKRRDGLTHIKNLYLCGTDQGFLGITGAMLSGITVSNLYLLK